MEKRISYSEFQQAKSVAKAIAPLISKKDKIQAQIDGLDEEFKKKAEEKLAKLKEDLKLELAEKRASLELQMQNKENDIALFETGIVSMLGVHVTSIVKKVMEPTGKTDPKTGKPIVVTKYLPTDIVAYDEQAKQYVITLPDDEETIVPPTTEDVSGSDFDADVENTEELVEETVPVEDEMPFFND